MWLWLTCAQPPTAAPARPSLGSGDPFPSLWLTTPGWPVDTRPHGHDPLGARSARRGCRRDRPPRSSARWLLRRGVGALPARRGLRSDVLAHAGPDDAADDQRLAQELLDAGVFNAKSAPQAGAAVVASEYLSEDFNTFAGLARRRVPVARLSQATGERPQRSARYRDVLAPAGIPFEMRAAFITRGRCAALPGRGEGRGGAADTARRARRLRAHPRRAPARERTSSPFSAPSAGSRSTRRSPKDPPAAASRSSLSALPAHR